MSFHPPFSPHAVVFDLDGLLVDSEGAWGEAERAVVESFGRPWDPEVRPLLLGRGPGSAAAVLAEHLGGVDPDEVARRLLAAAMAEFRKGIPLRPGAGPLLGALRGRLPLAVATNSSRVLAVLALESAGIDGLVHAVVCVEDVARPKPAPDPYLKACELLSADPLRSIAFEDSPVGMRSARDAGLWVIGCPSLPDEPTDAAHVLIASLGEVDAQAMLAAA